LTTRSEARANALGAPELAPYWHTAALVGLQLCVAITGTVLQHASRLPPQPAAPVPTETRLWALYLPLLVVNWGLVLYVCRLFRSGNALPSLIGKRWRSWPQAGLDLLLALAACVLVQSIEVLAARYLGTPSAGRNAALAALHPRTGAERLTWAFVAVNVGGCEEIVYRGYLQTQLTALTGYSAVGIALQAILFGVAHAEQGLAAAVRIAVYGAIFGCLAHFRRSLLPSMASHVAIDVASSFLR
jgi:membrane protease YdiL (CAAX protease family)